MLRQVNGQCIGLQPGSLAAGAGVVGSPATEKDSDGQLVPVSLEPIEEPVESSEVSFGNTTSDQFEVLG